jgi:hypothetical protein
MCSNRSGGFGNLDVWVSRRVGGDWQPAVNLGGTVNTAWIDSPRWLSDDGATLIIDSDRQGRLGGVDLWSVVKSGSDWFEPVNLGPPINSRFHEQGPGFIGNEGAIGGRIHFGSGRPGGYGGWDLWYSDFDMPIATAAAAADGSGPTRIPPVTSIAPRARTAGTDELVPTRRGCCSSGGS